jgi:hypothetical protein
MYEGNSIHKDALNVGQEFQDFIVEHFAKELGISISIFQSKKYQYNVGESLQGVEIKYDARSTGDCTYYECNATGNVAIEIAEKTKASNKDFCASGIYRRDNTWLYVVGNYDCAWVFAKSTLILLHNSKTKIYKINEMKTLRSMLLPIADADKFCAKKLIFKQ